MPVATFVAVTVTPGINALLESETVPPSVAFVVCANEFVKRTESRNTLIAKNLFIILPPGLRSGHAVVFFSSRGPKNRMNRTTRNIRSRRQIRRLRPMENTKTQRHKGTEKTPQI